MSKVFVFFAMIFCHIVDDYYLQGWLASAKQKEWWEKNAPQRLYQYDYIMALIMHGLSWSFLMMLPVVLYYRFDVSTGFLVLFVSNTLTHCIVDNEKANRKSINLIIDQICGNRHNCKHHNNILNGVDFLPVF